MFNSKILNIDYFLLNIDYLSFNPLSFIEYLSLKGNSKPLNIDYSFLHACSCAGGTSACGNGGGRASVGAGVRHGRLNLGWAMKLKDEKSRGFFIHENTLEKSEDPKSHPKSRSKS